MTYPRRTAARAATCAMILACLLVTAAPASAVPLLDTFGGPVGYGANVLPANDDGSSSAIPLAPAFPGGLNFFGGPYDQVWVNNNGNITFSGPVFNYTPMPFPVAMRPMIAAYCASGCVDLQTDTANCGFCQSQCTVSADRCTGGMCMCGTMPVCDLDRACTGGRC